MIELDKIEQDMRLDLWYGASACILTRDCAR